MGIRDKEWVKRTNEGFIIPHSRIRIGPWGNARSEFPEETIASRANSLILEGQKSYVSGLLSEDGEYFELIDGEIRWRAWEYAKKELGVDLDSKLGGMRCKLQDGFSRKRPTKSDILKLQLSYGTDTVPLSKYDQARNVKKLIDSGESVKDISILMHCTPQTIRNLIAIDSAPDHIKNTQKPSTAMEYTRSDSNTKKEIDRQVSTGKRVSVNSVRSERTKEKSRQKRAQERIPLPTKELRRLTDEEVQNQIKKLDNLKLVSRTQKHKDICSAMIRGMRITLGFEERI